MKPRTKLQFRVLEASKRFLFDRENTMLAWAKVSCLDHKGFATKTRVVCMDCGERFSPELVKRKRAVCPHCHTKLRITTTRKTTDKQSLYLAYAEIYEEFQLIRFFELNADYKAGTPAYYFIHEIMQQWISPNGKHEVVGKNHNLNYCCDSWTGDWEIRKYRPGYYCYANKFDVRAYFHPASEIKKEYRKYGIDKNMEGMTFLEAIRLVPNNPKAETLLKAKQYRLFAQCNGSNSHNIYNHWASIKICLRNKYKVKETKMWFDYLDLLQYFNKDLRNAHYVCPKNLKREHDRYMYKKRRIEEIQRIERAKQKAIEDEAKRKKFEKLKAAYFGLVFIDKDLTVKVLESLEEFKNEGDEMHHCVFTNEYHLKPDSLILSAMIDGIKTETVEVSLEEMRVVQCRGKFNKNTEYHDRIVNLVNRNIKKINQIKAS